MSSGSENLMQYGIWLLGLGVGVAFGYVSDRGRF